jgi:hypothetical protein
MERSRHAVLNWVAFLIGLAGTMLVFRLTDRIYGEVSIAPLLCIILLFALSMILRVPKMLAALALLLPFVVYSLVTASTFNPSQMESIVRFWSRLLGFAVAGVISVLAAYFRSRVVDMLRQTKTLLNVVPLPILLSDADGRIVWANQTCHGTQGIQATPGRQLLDVLPTDGSAIDYSLLFSSQGSLKPGALPEFDAKFVTLPATRRPLLATVLLPRRQPTSLQPSDT